MSKVRLREVNQPHENGAVPSESIPLKPLRVSGVVVSKADLIEALRVYAPALTNIEVVEDGERFLLSLALSTDGVGHPQA